MYGEEQQPFGAYLLKKRNEWGYTLKQLAEGLCSASELSRIESGERTPDKVFRDRLLARMGISPDLHEYFLFYDEYDPWKLRQQMLNAMIDRDLSRTEALLSSYRETYGREGKAGVSSRLEQQFCLSMEAQLARLKGAPKEKLAELFEKSLQLTAPRITQGIRGQALSVHEMDLLLETLRYKNPTEAREHYRELLIYIEQQVANCERERLAEEQSNTRSVGASERLLSTETYQNYGMLCGDFLRAVVKGETQTVATSVTAQFSTENISKGLKINVGAGVAISISYSYSGPDEYTPMPGVSGYASHRIFFAVLNGSIIRSNYALVDTSGNIVSTYSRYTVGGADASHYSTLVQNNNSNKYIVMNFDGTKCYNFRTFSNFLAKLEFSAVKSAFDF